MIHLMSLYSEAFETNMKNSKAAWNLCNCEECACEYYEVNNDGKSQNDILMH